MRQGALDGDARAAARSHEQACVDRMCCICLRVLSRRSCDAPPAWSRCPGCANLFHEKCLDKWFQTRGISCPVCRFTMKLCEYEESPEAWDASEYLVTLSDANDPSYRPPLLKKKTEPKKRKAKRKELDERARRRLARDGRRVALKLKKRDELDERARRRLARRKRRAAAAAFS